MHFEGTGDIADAILTGTYDTSQAPTEAAKWVIEALKYAAGSTEAIDAYVTPEELVGKLRAWNERTSTSPMTKVHLGHGKAYYAATTLDEDSPEYSCALHCVDAFGLGANCGG